MRPTSAGLGRSIAQLAAGIDLDRILTELKLSPAKAMQLLNSTAAKRQLAERRAALGEDSHAVGGEPVHGVRHAAAIANCCNRTSPDLQAAGGDFGAEHRVGSARGRLHRKNTARAAWPVKGFPMI